MKVAFDIGGVISRYPTEMKALMRALIDSGIEVHIMTDMNPTDTARSCIENNLDFIPEEHVHSCNWLKHGDRCKSIVMEEQGISILIDDRLDYCAEGNFIGLVLSPRPDMPYYHHDWSNKGTPAVCVPPEEYESFKAWQAQRSETKTEPELSSWKARIVIDPEISNSPIVKGTWVAARHVVDLIVEGWTWSDILRSHPELSEDDIRACLAFTVEKEQTHHL